MKVHSPGIVRCCLIFLCSTPLITCALHEPPPVSIEIRGLVVDSASQRPLGHAQVQVPVARVGVIADISGAFVLSGALPRGGARVTVAMIGFATVEREIHIRPGAHVIDVGTIALPARPIHLVPNICDVARERPRKADGKSIEQRRDSTGTFWIICNK